MADDRIDVQREEVFVPLPNARLGRPVSEYVTLDEAVQKYSVSRSTLFRWLKSGQLKGYRKPRDVRTYVSGGDVRKLVRYPLIPDEGKKTR